MLGWMMQRTVSKDTSQSSQLRADLLDSSSAEYSDSKEERLDDETEQHHRKFWSKAYGNA